MGRVKRTGKTKPIKLQTEERLRIFANLTIDRILEDKAQGRLPDLTKNKETW